MTVRFKGVFPLLLILWVCVFAGRVWALEPRLCPVLTDEVKSPVHRIIASKPDDLFVVLGNGLTVLLRRQTSADVVSAKVLVRAGVVYEGQYRGSGISHYLEHVVSGGSTRSFTEAEAKERLQRIGGTTNASTSYDRTTYYINTSAEHWKEAVDLLVSYVSECTLDPAEVAREKPVIQQEIKMGENSAERELWKLFLKTAYKVGPARDPVIGYEEVFVRLDREALLDYYQKRYRPENMVLVVAGNIDPVEVLRFIETRTGGFARGVDAPASWQPEPEQASARWEEREVPFARLVSAAIGFTSVNLHSRDLYALDVLAILLGEGESCRLQCRIKDLERQVLSISASNWTPSFTAGQFTIMLTLPVANWPGVMKSVEQEVDRFRTEAVEEHELKKAKKMAAAQHVFGKETITDQAGSLASSYFETGDPYFDEAYLQGIERVTPEDIRRVANRYLLMDRMNVAVMKPPAAGPTVVAGGEKADLPSPGKPPGQPLVDAPDVNLRLDNGLTVLLKKDRTVPALSLHLYGPGGLLLESPGKPGLSLFTASLLTAGTRTRTRQEMVRAIEEAGGALDARSDSNSYHVSIKVLREDMDLALETLADIARYATFPEDEVEKKRQETLLALQKSDENWQIEVARFFKQNYFKDSPYRNDRLGTPDSVKSFTRDDLTRFYARMVNPSHSVLAIYGDFEPEQFLPRIRQALGPWTGDGAPLPDLPKETHPLKADRVFEKKNQKSCPSLFVGTNGLPFGDPDRPVLDVLDAVLSGSGSAGGRLFEGLRGGHEDLVYIVGATPFSGRNAGFFAVITQTTQANLDKVQGIIEDQLRKLTTELVPESELETARNAILTAYKLESESMDARARRVAFNTSMGLGVDYETKYMAAVSQVKAEDVRRVAKELFDHLLVVRMLPEKPVEILGAPGKS